MILKRQYSVVAFITALLAASLACRAVTGGNPPPSSPSGISSAVHERTPPTEPPVACPAVVADVLDFARYGTTPVDGLGSAQSVDADIEVLVTYAVEGNEIRDPDFESVPNRLTDERDDTGSHQAVWDYFIMLIPSDFRTMIAAYRIITDGPDNVLGAVSQINSPDEWVLEIDIEDSHNALDLTYTFLHEYGHLLTLNAQQVDLSQAVFDQPENDLVFDRAAAACPRYFPGEGCSRPGSYLDEFYEQFWAAIYDEWLEIDQITEQNAYEDQMGEFYRRYQDQFVSDYAVTSPAEDIAETWTYFVLQGSLDAGTIADQKVLYFYSKPELVEMRTEILGNLCQAFPK